MPQNRGKKFEDVFRDCVEKVPDTTIVRLPDPVMGYLGYRNICDFIVYNYPHQYFIECKSCHGTSFPFSNITKNQYNGLLNVSPVKGVHAGVVIWYVDYDKTFFIPITTIKGCREQGWKSLNYKRAENLHYALEIHGRKKRVFFDYDLRRFFNEARGNL